MKEEITPPTLVTLSLPWTNPKIPPYREARYNGWSIEKFPALRKAHAGYFLPSFARPGGHVMKHKGKSIWMSMTTMEIESHMPHIDAAHGDVLIMGLGMGFVLYNIARKQSVKSVTVIEFNPDIIALLDKATDLKSWPGWDKVKIITADALTYKPPTPPDFLYVDIWPTMGDDRALEDTKRIQQNVNAALVGYWTQEWDYVSFCQNLNLGTLGIGRYSYRKFARLNNLPLIEQGNDRYPFLCFASVTLQIMAQTRDAYTKEKLRQSYAKNMELSERGGLFRRGR